MKAMRVVMLGASGAVGSAALAELLAMPEIAQVTALVRRPLDGVSSPKLAVDSVDVTKPASYAALLAGHDVALCTFGVGQPTKVSKVEFTAIDYDAVLDFAKACRAAGVQQFTLLGSVAADPRSRSFYLRSKGLLREAIAGLGFARFSCFQPSVLITPRNRYGLSQAVVLALWPGLSRLMLGPARRYRGIRVEDLGKAMARHLAKPGAGNAVLHWDDFQALLRP